MNAGGVIFWVGLDIVSFNMRYGAYFYIFPKNKKAPKSFNLSAFSVFCIPLK